MEHESFLNLIFVENIWVLYLHHFHLFLFFLNSFHVFLQFPHRLMITFSLIIIVTFYWKSFFVSNTGLCYVTTNGAFLITETKHLATQFSGMVCFGSWYRPSWLGGRWFHGSRVMDPLISYDVGSHKAKRVPPSDSFLPTRPQTTKVPQPLKQHDC